MEIIEVTLTGKAKEGDDAATTKRVRVIVERLNNHQEILNELKNTDPANVSIADVIRKAFAQSNGRQLGNYDSQLLTTLLVEPAMTNAVKRHLLARDQIIFSNKSSFWTIPRNDSIGRAEATAVNGVPSRVDNDLILIYLFKLSFEAIKQLPQKKAVAVLPYDEMNQILAELAKFDESVVKGNKVFYEREYQLIQAVLIHLGDPNPYHPFTLMHHMHIKEPGITLPVSQWNEALKQGNGTINTCLSNVYLINDRSYVHTGKRFVTVQLKSGPIRMPGFTGVVLMDMCYGLLEPRDVLPCFKAFVADWTVEMLEAVIDRFSEYHNLSGQYIHSNSVALFLCG